MHGFVKRISGCGIWVWIFKLFDRAAVTETAKRRSEKNEPPNFLPGIPLDRTIANCQRKVIRKKRKKKRPVINHECSSPPSRFDRPIPPVTVLDSRLWRECRHR